MKPLRTFIAASLIAAGAIFASASPAVNVDSGSESTAIHAVASQTPSVKVEHSRVDITIPGDQPKQVAIYALTGQVVKQVVAHPGSTTSVDLPTGYYIIKIDRFSQKVVVK